MKLIVNWFVRLMEQVCVEKKTELMAGFMNLFSSIFLIVKLTEQSLSCGSQGNLHVRFRPQEQDMACGITQSTLRKSSLRNF
jgi:hypothetical protein